ncbi:MAG: hypothetical protein JWQ62_3071 [Lacunisphaera sp.]|nr:hypothetical protein [Lacunisphaera sp.]
MKTIPRLALIAAAALGAALFFSGCTTAGIAKAGRPAHFYDMTVVQSSGPVDLSPKVMTQLRESVINFVQKEGVLLNGAYYVEVRFNPGAGETEGGWMVVKLVERNAGDFELVASYPDQGPYYYDPYYNRYGYASFGNYPFDSFDYAYGGGYSPPRLHPRGHRPPNDDDHNDNGHHTDNDHRHDGRHEVAHHDGGDDHRHSPGSGGDHRSPEPRRRERSDTSYSPPSSRDGGSSYSPSPSSSPAPSNPEPASRSNDPIGRDSGPVAAR